jgi:ethanolamine ammonia-lyase large subunit
MDALLTLLAVAGVNFVMGVPGADDVMLNYQTTSFHDAMYVRQVLGLRPAPEFEAWLRDTGIFAAAEGMTLAKALPASFRPALANLG